MKILLVIFTLLTIGCEGGPSGTAGAGGGSTESSPEATPVTNNLPVTVVGSFSTAFNTTVSVSLSASDSDSDSLTYYLVDQPAHGSITCTEQTCSFVPETGYSGSDSFTFLANDGTGDSNTSTVSLSIGTNPDACSGNQNTFTVDGDFIKNSTGMIGTRSVLCTGSHLIPNVIYDNGSAISNGVSLSYTTASGNFRACYYKSRTQITTGGGTYNKFIKCYVGATSNCNLFNVNPDGNVNCNGTDSNETYLSVIKDDSFGVTKF